MGVAIQNHIPARGLVRHKRATIYTIIIQTNAAARNKNANAQIEKTTGHEIGHHFYLPEVRSIGRTVTFSYEGLENRTKGVNFPNPQGRSIMQQGMYVRNPERYASYHMVPDALQNNEQTPFVYSTLPDFSPVFDTTSIPINLHNNDNLNEGESSNEESLAEEPEEQVVDSRICPMCNKAASTSPIGSHPTRPHLIDCSICNRAYMSCIEIHVERHTSRTCVQCGATYADCLSDSYAKSF